jgi:hypothetical protein
VIHRPPSKRILTVKARFVVSGIPPGARVVLADLLWQAGSTKTLWVPHVTEMPWAAGVSGG